MRLHRNVDSVREPHMSGAAVGTVGGCLVGQMCFNTDTEDALGSTGATCSALPAHTAELVTESAVNGARNSRSATNAISEVSFCPQKETVTTRSLDAGMSSVAEVGSTLPVSTPALVREPAMPAVLPPPPPSSIRVPPSLGTPTKTMGDALQSRPLGWSVPSLTSEPTVQGSCELFSASSHFASLASPLLHSSELAADMVASSTTVSFSTSSAADEARHEEARVRPRSSSATFKTLRVHFGSPPINHAAESPRASEGFLLASGSRKKIPSADSAASGRVARVTSSVDSKAFSSMAEARLLSEAPQLHDVIHFNSATTGSSQIDGPHDEEMAAAEERILTNQAWELEGEKIRLESELAVLRGPVKTDTQNLASEHTRLQEQLRALDAAAVLAMEEQQSKRVELDKLIRLEGDLKQRRDESTVLLSTFKARLSVILARTKMVTEEESKLAAEKMELEGSVLPAEEQALHDAQELLQKLRSRRDNQEKELKEKRFALHAIKQSAECLQQQLAVLPPITAVINKVAAPFSEDVVSPSLATSEQQQEQKQPEHLQESVVCCGDEQLHRQASEPLLEISTRLTEETHDYVGGLGVDDLPTRLSAVKNEIASFHEAIRALYESAVLTEQNRAMHSSLHRICASNGTWEQSLRAAQRTLDKLRDFLDDS